MAGSAGQSVKRRYKGLPIVALALITVANSGFTQALYKYRGPDGEWIYTDRAPQEETPVEIRELPLGMTDPRVTVYHEFTNGNFNLIARNEYYAPVEVILALDSLDNISFPRPEYSNRWVVAPRSRSLLMQLPLIEKGGPHG